MWLSDVLERNCQVHADRVAIQEGEQRVTFHELEDAAARLAAGLMRQGVRRGDRVIVISRNRPEVLVAYFGLSLAGAISVPVNHALLAHELGYIVENSGAVAALGEHAGLEKLPRHRLPVLVDFDTSDYSNLVSGPRVDDLPEVARDDLFAILFTSATTGKPKGVMVDYASIESVYRRLGADLDLAPGNVFLNCCPLFHGTLVWNLAYLAAGSTVTMLREFTPQAFLRLVERARVTHVFMVPSMLRFTLAARALRTTDLSSLSQLVYGGAPMPRALLDQALAVFPCGFRNCYGITEAGGPVTCLTPDDHRASASDRRSSVGRAHAGYELRVVDPDGNPLGAFEPGEICIRGDGLMRGYWRNPAASNVVLRAGWVYTGDIGYLDDDGYLFMGDRRADLIISAGENVYPAEIEAILQLHPAVLDATVIGVPDEALGEVPWAYVVSQSHKSVSAEELYAFCAQRLARHKLPARIQFLAEIPRSDIGKPLRRVLRQLASA